MSEAERTFSPTEAAEHIDFAPSLLRRYAAEYEAHGGSIVKDKRGGRIYTETILKHFASARERVQGGELLSEALRTLDVINLAPEKPLRDAETALSAQQVLSLLERLLDDNQALRSQISELESKVTAFVGRPQIEPSNQDAIKRAAKTDKMNRYLLGELERRRLEAVQQTSGRVWWRFWEPKR